VLDAFGGAQLQADLPGLRILHVLLGLLLKKGIEKRAARPHRGKRFFQGTNTTKDLEEFQEARTWHCE
jgi:hypothetical protein